MELREQTGECLLGLMPPKHVCLTVGPKAAHETKHY
jgi:hypothetical protein